VTGVENRILRAIVGRRLEVPEVSPTHDAREVERRTDELNVAAEQYFVDIDNPEFLIQKPYSEPVHFPRYLFNLGVMVQKGHIAPGHRVLELGAGTAWVSHFLNRFGCYTIAMDVSSTALGLAEEVFRRDTATRWDLEPRFLTYDGHRIPLDDGSCDRIVIHDAFHHIPNQEEILSEMERVLAFGGIVAMTEPGRAHSESETSQREMSQFGVLENDIVVEELAELARAAGFTSTTILPIALQATPEVPAEKLADFVRGEGLADWWREMGASLFDQHFIFLHKGPYVPDSRSPSTLRAQIEPLFDGDPLRVAVGESVTLGFKLRNVGDTRWLPSDAGRPGAVCFAAYPVQAGEGAGGRVNRDWKWSVIPDRVEPNDTVTLELELPPFEAPGEHLLVFDLVADGVAWFEDTGSRALRLPVVVS